MAKTGTEDRCRTATVDALRTAGDREVIYWDHRRCGASGCSVYPNGAKTYLVQGRGPAWLEAGRDWPARDDLGGRSTAPAG